LKVWLVEQKLATFAAYAAPRERDAETRRRDNGWIETGAPLYCNCCFSVKDGEMKGDGQREMRREIAAFPLLVRYRKRDKGTESGELGRAACAAGGINAVRVKLHPSCNR
jgi:hypothetical protein